jgi:hypothetical protein
MLCPSALVSNQLPEDLTHVNHRDVAPFCRRRRHMGNIQFGNEGFAMVVEAFINYFVKP